MAKTSNGFVYVLIHPRHPGWFKIGKAVDLQRRLSSYQAGDPARQYRFILARKVTDMNGAEQQLMQRLCRLGYVPHGEWFEVPLCVLHKQISKLFEVQHHVKDIWDGEFQPTPVQLSLL